jgi:ABC-2 type transport system permease protein
VKARELSTPLFSLLTPFLLAARNRFLPAGRPSLRALGIVLFSAAVATGLYLIARRVLGYFHAQSELGIILSLKIFEMTWIVLFAMVLFSCMVAAVSTLFLSKDNEILFAAPVPPARLFAMRYTTTSLYAGWMLFLFMLPVLLAYGQVFAAGPGYWLLLPLALLATILTATGAGMLLTIILVNLFPARRTKDIVLYLSVCFGVLIYLMFRLLRPEELVNPDNYGHFIEYLSALSAPTAPYVPAAWAANLLSLYLLDRELDLLLAALLLITPAALFILGEGAMARWFFRGYSKSCESFGGDSRFGSRAAAYRPRPWRWIFHKEAKSFLRDSTEWAQLFMVGALIVVYLYNFKILPLDRAFIGEEYLANLIAFLNIGLTAFVCASLAGRFVFPAVSAEGGAIVLLQSAPLSMRAYLLRKYLFYLPPFTVLALLLILFSNHLLGVSGPIWWISLGIIMPLTWALPAIALGFGAIYADFKAANRAATAGGWGALLFLLTAMSFAIISIGGVAYPAWRILRGWLRHGFLAPGDLPLLLGALLLATLLAAAVGIFFFLKGAKALDSLAR